MKEKMKTTDWLNSFVEKNMWAILGLLVMAGVFVTRVKALEDRVSSIEEAQFTIVENQKAIIEIQTKQANVEEDIDEIKTDIRDIKNSLVIKVAP